MALTPEKDISREGISSDKLLAIPRLMVPDNNKALLKVDEFSSINLQRIQQITGRQVRGVILDIDETVAEHHGEILPENMNHIVRWTQDGVRVLVNSNMKASDRYNALVDATKGLVIVHCSKFSKPSEENFKECQEILDLPEENLLMVGDNPMTDGGSVRAGIPFAQVTPVPSNEGVLRTLKRSPQLVTRAAFRGLSNHFDFLYGRDVLKDQDLTFGFEALLESELRKNLLDGLSNDQLQRLITTTNGRYIALLNLLEKVETRIYKQAKKTNRRVPANSQLEKKVLSGDYRVPRETEIYDIKELSECMAGRQSVDNLIVLQQTIVQQLFAEFERIREIIQQQLWGKFYNLDDTEVNSDLVQLEYLEVSNGKKIGILKFNDNKRKNAMTEEMALAFKNAVRELKETDDVRVVIVTGEGSAFSAGGDMGMIKRNQKRSVEINRIQMRAFYQAYLDLFKLNIPVIAAVNGPAIGAGLAFAAACDKVIASKNANKLGFSFSKLGLTPGMGTTIFTPRRIGEEKTQDLIESAKNLTAEEAEEIGLVDSSVEPELLLITAITEALKTIEDDDYRSELVDARLSEREIYHGLNKEAQLQGASFRSPEHLEKFKKFMKATFS